MLNIEQVLKQDRLLRALTGMNRKAFEALLPTFNDIYQKSIIEQQGQPRQRAIGGGRKACLEQISAKLLFILVYFKCYPTFDLAGFIFGIHRSVAHCRLYP
jgi:hypothetical protein